MGYISYPIGVWGMIPTPAPRPGFLLRCYLNRPVKVPSDSPQPEPVKPSHLLNSPGVPGKEEPQPYIYQRQRTWQGFSLTYTSIIRKQAGRLRKGAGNTLSCASPLPEPGGTLSLCTGKHRFLHVLSEQESDFLLIQGFPHT